MSYRVLVFVLVVGSCGPALKVPQVASGNVPFRVINDTDFKYCEFLMAEPHDPPNGLGPSWIGKGRSVDPHTSFDLKIHPGLYQIYAGACENVAKSWILRVQIDGPSEVSLAGAPGGAPGVTHIALHHEARQYYGPAGGGPSEPAGEASEQPGGESNEPAAEAPAGEPCKGPGEEVNGINDCCSHRDRTVGSSHNGGHYVCCAETGPCEGTP